MKKLTLFTAALFSALGVAAQINPTPVAEATNSFFFWLPTQYSYSGETQLLTALDHEDGIDGYGYQVLDKDFKIVKSFLTKDKLKPRRVKFYSSSEPMAVESFIEVTQTLFNTDENYEYLSLLDDNGVTTSNYGTSIVIMSDNGHEVSRLTAPEGYEFSLYDLSLVEFVGYKTYLVVGLDDKNNDYISTINVYEIDRASTSLRKVEAPALVNVFPRLARKSQPVTVSFDGQGTAPRTVEVVSASGRRVFARNVPASETSCTINTSRLDQGLYVVTVTEDGTSRENCKIVIK